jgi:hypothetical protein
MYKFRGFVTIRPLWSNTPNVVSPIGELSAYGSTFAKDTQLYAKAASDVAVVGFTSSAAGVYLAAPDLIQTQVIEIAEWVDGRQKALTLTENAKDFKLAFEIQFPTAAGMVEIGEMVTASSGRLYPSYVAWKSLTYLQDNSCILYFSDEVFRQDYDDYEVVVIPPLAPIDTFFIGWAEACKLVEAVTWSDVIENIQVARKESPETILTSDAYNFVNVLNKTSLKSTSWTFLIYGPRGNDPDAIKAALIAFITKNSTKSLDKWKEIFPDIFRTTEFLFLPEWDSMAIPNLSITLGVYSPVVKLGAGLQKLKTLLPAYPEAHLNAFACTMGYPYRSLAMSVVGSPENRDSKFLITDVFPDFIAVASTSLDFNRMATATKVFSEKLASMIYLAEKLTSASVVPSGYRKSQRSGVSYLASSIGSINYLVASRNNLFT